jgi:glyoxylase-like metal-dependent hydrolase (beta-lactamase superfamily II)
LLTHGHFDHVAGIRHTDAKIVMHEADLKVLNQTNIYLPAFGIPEITIPQIDIFIKDNDIIKLGQTEIKVIHTPGHTQGGVCYLVGNMLFSGDTIFRESVGRCDLEGGNFDQIVESINTKIFTLPEDIAIYPGHGRQTTVGWEKVHNCFM